MKILILILTLVLGGCATNNYQQYYEAQKAVAEAKSRSDTARYTALAEIAKMGDTAAKVAAVMSLQGSATAQQQSPVLQAPRDWSDRALQWVSVLLPQATQIYTIAQNARVNLAQSNNSTALGIAQSDNQYQIASSTNQTFLGMASKIQGNTTTTTTHNTTVTGNYNVGSNSGNSGKIAGYDLTDNTSVPTVVKPEVVNTTTTTTNTTNSNNTTTGGP